MESNTTLDERLASVAALLDGFNATWVVATITKSGIAKAIAQWPGISTPDLSRRLGFREEPVEVLCRAAYAQGLLVTSGSRGWSLAPFVSEVLADDTSLSYLGGFFWYAVAASREYDQFLSYLRNGKPVSIAERSNEYVVGVEEGGKSTYRFLVQVVLPQVHGLGERLEADAAILEIGCGSGVGIELLSEKFRRPKIVGLDVDGRAIQRARSRLSGKSNLHLIERAAEEMDYADEFDLALMVFTLHELRDPASVVRLVYAALKDGGVMINMDLPFMEQLEDYTEPAARTMALLHFGEALQGTPLLSNAKVEHMAREAGFRNLSRIQVHPLLHATVAMK